MLLLLLLVVVEVVVVVTEAIFTTKYVVSSVDGIFAKDLGLRITEARPWVQGWSKMAAEVTEKSLSDKPIFSCSSCAFECHYEYFGKKPPCSKSVM